MRNLETRDIFSASRLILEIGVREEIQEVAKRAEESKDNKAKIDMGFDLFFGILSKAVDENNEEKIYKFIANILECDWIEVSKMDPFDLYEKLKEVAPPEKWTNFFKCVAKLIPKK